MDGIPGPQCAFKLSMFMCPAVHTTTRSLLRLSSTHEPSDPPLRVIMFCLKFSFNYILLFNGSQKLEKEIQTEMGDQLKRSNIRSSDKDVSNTLTRTIKKLRERKIWIRAPRSPFVILLNIPTDPSLSLAFVRPSTRQGRCGICKALPTSIKG